MSNSPEGKKEEVPKTQAASADDDGQNATDGGQNANDGAKTVTDQPTVVDEDSAYDDLFPDESGKGSQGSDQTKESKGQTEPNSQTAAAPEKKLEPVKPTNSWPLVRKFEALIFMAMFAAVPLFAVRVIQYTHDQLIVRNVSKELVKDLQRAKTLAVQRQQPVEVSGATSKSAKLFSYVVLIGEKVSEEVVLPESVSVVGSIKFNKTGMPERASSFIVSSENRTTTVEIDPTGLISVPY